MKKSITIFLLGIICSWSGIAQSSCVINGNERQRSSTDFHVNTNVYTTAVSDLEFCIQVQVFNIAGNDPANGIPDSILNTQVDYLNSEFAGSGIHFEWDEVIHDITDQSIYDSEFITTGACWTADLSPLNGYGSDNTLDLFFHGDNIPASAVEGYGETRVLFTRGHVSTSSIHHEIGHILGLFHTRHGTLGFNASDGSANNLNCENSDGFFGHVVECPDGSNAASSGDYVSDTVASNGSYTFNAANCSGSAVNDFPLSPLCGTTPFPDPDIQNFMETNPVFDLDDCRSEYSPKQYVRMKYVLWEEGPMVSLPIHNTLISCNTDPGPCDDCNGAEGSANNVFNNYLTNDGCEYTLSFPIFGTACPDQYEISWNGETGTLFNPEDTVTTTYTVSGSQTVAITVIRDGEPCGTFSYTIDVDEACEEIDCERSCTETMDGIYDSITLLTDSIGCWGYSIDIPNIEGCYTGKVFWGDGTNEHFVSNSTMTHYYSTTGSFKIVLVLKNPDGTRCDKASKVIQINCSSPKSLVPNPTAGSFRIDANDLSDVSEVIVRDIYGTVVTKKLHNFNSEINLSARPAGVYFVEIKSKNNTSVIKKLILQK